MPKTKELKVNVKISTEALAAIEDLKNDVVHLQKRMEKIDNPPPPRGKEYRIRKIEKSRFHDYWALDRWHTDALCWFCVKPCKYKWEAKRYLKINKGTDEYAKLIH